MEIEFFHGEIEGINMKNKGIRYERATDAIKRFLDDRYTMGHVICTSKKHPNYFVCEIYDSWTDEWKLNYMGYISAYMNSDGSFVKV